MKPRNGREDDVSRDAETGTGRPFISKVNVSIGASMVARCAFCIGCIDCIGCIGCIEEKCTCSIQLSPKGAHASANNNLSIVEMVCCSVEVICTCGYRVCHRVCYRMYYRDIECVIGLLICCSIETCCTCDRRCLCICPCSSGENNRIEDRTEKDGKGCGWLGLDEC